MRTIRLASTLFATVGCACALAAGQIDFLPDAIDARYACGETAVVKVTALDDAGRAMPTGTVTVCADDFGPHALVPARTVDLAKENPFEIRVSRSTPGFARIRVTGLTKKPAIYGLGYDVEKIVSGTPDVADFDAFWSDAVEKLAKTVPLDPRVERIERAGAYDVFRVSFATCGGRRVWGWLVEPKDRSGAPFPVYFTVPGAGIGFTNPPGGIPGAVCFAMNVHSYPQPEGVGREADARRKAAYDEQDARFAVPNGVKSYWHAGIHKSREDYFYYASILGINRALDWVVARPECDARRVSYEGTSQGGGMGLILTYLNRHIAKSCIFVPAMTDLLGFRVEGRESGWPKLIEGQRPENRAAAERNAPYFCGVNFARRIRKPIRFVVGFSDCTCPPAAVYAAYNACPSADKRISDGLGMGHRVYDDFYSLWRAWKADWNPAPSVDFLPQGRMTLGANYWASPSATEMWRKWDAKAVDADLKTLADCGMKVLRVFPNWADFQPIHACHLSGGAYDRVYETRMFDSEEPLPDTPCGRAGVDERMVEHFEEFCDLAEKHGLKLIVPLLTGQMTFRNLIPPALANRNPFSDPYALMWEGRYLECLVTRLKAKRAIAAWAAGNEASILGRCESRFHAETWTRYVHSTIRLADPSRPIVGLHHLAISREEHWPTKMNADMADCTTTHPYGFWGSVYNDDFRSVRSVTFAPAETLAQAQIGGKPAFIEEHGSRRQEQASQAHVADYMRAMLWNAWAADNRAMLWWCAFDQTGLTIAPYNWRQPCVELGIFTRDRRPYPAAAVVKSFAAMQENLPFAALPQAKTDAVVLTTSRDIVFSTYVLARQAGIFPLFANPEEKLPEATTYFLPDALGRAYLTIERWEELKAKVRAGATLYISWNDTFLDEMEKVGGIEVDCREKSAGSDVCDFGDFKVTVDRSVRRRFKSLTAETLAHNQDGDGVFFRNRYGKGTVYVFAHNFEKTFYGSTGKYEGDAWRIWAKVCPVKRILATGEKNVFVSEHRFDGGRCAVIAVNNRSVAYRGVPRLAPGWRVDAVLTDDSRQASWQNGRLTLAPDSGVLLMTSKAR